MACPHCNDTKRITCPRCKGTGIDPRRKCATCGGFGWVQDGLGNTRQCPDCDGQGNVTCPTCEGNRVCTCPACL